jgi:ribokinase
LNVSPITADIEKLPLSLADIIFVNETEARAICNEFDNEKLLDSMSRKFPRADVILTLGENGAKCKTADGNEYSCPAHKVSVCDTTAAGDTFTGYYVAAIAEGKTTDEALRAANAAAAITVSRKGASASIPKLGEVNDFINALK